MALAPLSHVRFSSCTQNDRMAFAATLIFLLSFGCEGRQSTAQRLEKAYQSAGMDPVTALSVGREDHS